MATNPLLLTSEEANPGTSRAVPLKNTLLAAKSNNGINQIRGTAAKNATSFGVPKHVTNVGAAISTGSKGSTSTVRVTFHRDPSDKAYSATAIWVKGYQGNGNPVQVASSYESPATFVLNNTGEPVSVVAQATGNSGQAPLDAAPTTGLRLPKSNNGGFGTNTVTAYTTSNPPPSQSTNVAYMLGPGIISPVQVSTLSVGDFAFPTPLVVSVCGFGLSAGIAGLTHLDGSFGSGSGPGSNFAVGFYDTSGNRLWSSGICHVANVSNVASSFTVPALTLAPGNYYMAWSSDDTSTTTWVTTSNAQLTFHSGSSDGNVINQGAVLVGTAANAATTGPVLPATLGTLSIPTSAIAIPLVLFR